MVKEQRRKGRPVYLCEVCGFGYADLETAERCEQYCYTHGSCSLDIAKKAVYKPRIRVIS